MATGESTKPSFSRSRKWAIGLNVVFTVLVVLSVVVMVNYLAAHYLRRFYVSDNAQTELSPRTLSLLSSMTNRVEIILYYDKDEMFYNDIYELLKAYRTHSQNNISLERVDFNRDPGKALEIKAKYKLAASEDKNLIIFDCEGRRRIVPGSVLPEYTYEQITNQPGLKYNYKLISFKGEMLFTASLLAVINPKPMRACFLQGHGEHLLDDTGDWGFGKFAMALAENNVRISSLKLLGTNSVPADCDLLVIAGPQNPIPQIELDRIEQYLNDGGRVLALCRASSRETGLEKLLARWGVEVSDQIVKDPDATHTGDMLDVIISDFSKHPVVSPLRDSDWPIQLIKPRALRKIESPQIADDLKVEEIARSGPRSFLQGDNPVEKPQSYPLIVAVEKNPVKGATDRGPTRILAVGDSIFLDNGQIESAANRAFADYLFNWLLDRSLTLQGVGPRPMTGYRYLLSTSQQKVLLWILLGAVPGGILLFGGLVWIRRRK
jgi:gliding motility-associatede transport system auxiliary component